MILQLDCVWWVCWGKGDFEIELIAGKSVWVRFTRVHKLYKEMRSDPIWDNETIVIASSPNSRGWTKIEFGYMRKGKQFTEHFVLTVVGASHMSVTETCDQITVEKFQVFGIRNNSVDTCSWMWTRQQWDWSSVPDNATDISFIMWK